MVEEVMDLDYSNSVVTKDIPSNVVAVGNPCRVVRKINK